MLLRPHTPESRPFALQRLRWLARFLDNAITIPGTKVSLGYDALIGLIPVAGDVVTTAAALYIVLEAKRLGASNRTIWKMLGNVALDFALGEVPLIGDVGDVFFRANLRNLKLLESELASSTHQHPPAHAPAPASSPARNNPPRRRVENAAA